MRPGQKFSQKTYYNKLAIRNRTFVIMGAGKNIEKWAKLSAKSLYLLKWKSLNQLIDMTANIEQKQHRRMVIINLQTALALVGWNLHNLGRGV